MRIILIGSRGCGKTAVGAELAGRLGLEFRDADAEIAGRAGCSIKEIFAGEGERGFRRRERAVMAELLAGDDLVLAAGGGAVLDPDTRGELSARGHVVWLTAPPEELAQRIADDEATDGLRPPLRGGDVLEEIAGLLADREPIYRESATLEVATAGRTVSEVVRTILAAVAGPGNEPES